MLVALGVSLVVVAAQISGIAPGDMSRVLQGLLAGVGFLGAGAIIKQSEKEQVKGLTTAASLWAIAAIAVAVGLGREATAILSTVLTFVILSTLRRLEQRVERLSEGQAGKDPASVTETKEALRGLDEATLRELLAIAAERKRR
jgi:putative Mg2+ transporter-C (MgtC) family protein